MECILSYLYIALSYANGYKSDTDKDFYMISVAIPGWDENYKYLSGAAFTIPISIVGIFMVRFNLINVLF